MTKKPLVSVVVPAFNEEAFLGQTLKQISFAFKQNADRNIIWDLIVCDNNSTDRTATIATEAGAAVVFEPINQISQARNSGAKIANGEWLLFIDADTYPTPQLIAQVCDVIQSKRYIGCGTTITVRGGTLFNKLRMERLNPLFRLFNWCGGAFLLCENQAYRTVGGFSANLYAYEEVDFVLRLKKLARQRGKKFTVLHQHPAITSGRKGEYGLFSLGSLYVSNLVAIALFVLHYLLPKELVRKLGSRLLGYWYASRR